MLASVITVPAVLPYRSYSNRELPQISPHSRSNYCGYRGITAFSITAFLYYLHQSLSLERLCEIRSRFEVF